MRVIDARSGQDMKIGETVRYGGGEWLRLIDVDEGLLSANATIEHCYRDYGRGVDAGFVTSRAIVPLAVRFLHPSFFLQRVAFIPS